MDARTKVTKGMTVYTQDGEKLGKVVSIDDTGLFVEKGHFFPKEFGFGWEDVADVRGDGVHLALDRESVKSTLHGQRAPAAIPHPAQDAAVRQATPAGSAPRPGTPPTREVDEGRTIPMVGEGIAPMLVEEEVVVVKQVPVPGADRRASPDDPEMSRTAPGTGRTDPGGSHG